MIDINNNEKARKAMELFRMGYNCSQSVAGAWCDEINLSMDTAVRISAGFGGGMGRMREVCGAVSGAFMILGMVFSTGNPDPESKKYMYEIIQAYAARFKEENRFGSIICREMLGLKGAEAPVPAARTEEYYKKRPCPEIIGMASALLEEFITPERLSEYSALSGNRKNIRIVTFGNFGVYVNGKAVKFKRSKSLEALAFLVDRRTPCTKKQIAACLFEDRTYDRSCQKYVDNILRALKSDLDEAGAGSLLVHSSNSYSVNASECTCDYYEYIEGRITVRKNDEYMSQYSWAEETLASIR